MTFFRLQKQEPVDSGSDLQSSPGSDPGSSPVGRAMDQEEEYGDGNNCLTPPSSAGEDDKNSRLGSDEFLKELKTPKVNSHGKVRTFRCKQCGHVAVTKWDHWDHCKDHIRPDKRLLCGRCPFVTDLKHHLEFHILNHEGVKPFSCEQCQYTCVNKSMLTSHRKSHSNVYSYNCADCVYATKYCHSLKTHLKKYRHKPGVVLNPDGTPNPTLSIDVYGKRRGPKLKSQPTQKAPAIQPPVAGGMPLTLGDIMLRSAQLTLPFPGMQFFPGVQSLPFIHPLLSRNLENVVKGVLPTLEHRDPAVPSERESPAQPIDLSRPATVQRSRRKGRAVKLLRHNSTDDELTTVFNNVEVVQSEEEAPKKTEVKPDPVSLPNLTCSHCGITFGDHVLYTLHMGYHGYGNPFTCNMCGEVCGDKYKFFMHMASKSHP